MNGETKILCISASNRQYTEETNSHKICKAIISEAEKYLINIKSEIVELKDYELSPCSDCPKHPDNNRCAIDDAFNQIYEKIIACDALFIVTPHYAPIPAKLMMLLEKMGVVVFRHRDGSYKSDVYDTPTAIISHGGNSAIINNEDALKRRKRVVNDPIANGLITTQLKLIPFDDEWNTGIVLTPINDGATDREILEEKLTEYIHKVIDNIIKINNA